MKTVIKIMIFLVVLPLLQGCGDTLIVDTLGEDPVVKQVVIVVNKVEQKIVINNGACPFRFDQVSLGKDRNEVWFEFDIRLTSDTDCKKERMEVSLETVNFKGATTLNGSVEPASSDWSKNWQTLSSGQKKWNFSGQCSLNTVTIKGKVHCPQPSDHFLLTIEYGGSKIGPFACYIR